MKVINAWVNVLIAALIMVATLPGRTQGLGLITEPLLRDLNVDRVSYGSAHLGRIQGAAQMLTVLASAVGPLMFAKSVELTGSYMPVLRILAPAVALLGIAALRVRLPLISVPVEAAASTGAVK